MREDSQRPRRDSARTDLAISVAFHSVIAFFLFFWAAHEGVLGARLKELTVAIVPKEKPPEPPPPPPVIEPPRKAAEFFTNPGKFDLKLIASLQPGSQPLKQILPAQMPASVLILIGPEGDFTPAEISSARNAGCLPLSLGPLVLRAETAAIYTLSSLHHELQVRA